MEENKESKWAVTPLGGQGSAFIITLPVIKEIEESKLQDKIISGLQEKISSLEKENTILKEEKENIGTVAYLSGSQDSKERIRELEKELLNFPEWMSGIVQSNYKSGGTWYVNGKFMTTKELYDQYKKTLKSEE